MELVNMKLSKEKAKESIAPCCETEKPNGPEYPYGLRIRLDKEQIQKLKLKGCTIDEEVTIQAKGEVISMSLDKSQNDDDRHNIEIQITDIEIILDSDFENGFNEAAKGGK